MSPVYLADKSALARMRIASVATVLEPLISANEVATCGVVDLEVLFSAQSYDDIVHTRLIRARVFSTALTLQADFDRAIDVMMELAKHGQHRAVGVPDLVIAAVAERSNLIVIHYDEDFDRISAVTGQDTRWVVPRGSI